MYLRKHLLGYNAMVIDYYYKNIKSEKLEKIDENRVGAWIRVTNATQKDLEELMLKFDLENEDLVDCLDEFEIPRLEKLNNGILLILKVPKSDLGSSFTETFSLILTDKNVITISLSTDEFLDNLKYSKLNLSTTQKYKIILSFLKKITDEFTYEIKKVRHQVLSDLSLHQYHNLTERDIVKLTHNDEVLSQYLAVLIPMRLVFTSIKTGSYFKIFEEDSDLLEDMILSINQSVEIAGTNMKSIRSLRDSYQILFTNKLNNEIRILTYLTISLTIPTLIASFFGMNVPLPFQTNPNALGIILILCIVLAYLVLFVLGKITKK